MTTRTAVSISFICVVALVLGLVAGFMLAPSGPDMNEFVELTEHQKLGALHEDTLALLRKEEEEKGKAIANNQELRARVEALSEELQELKSQRQREEAAEREEELAAKTSKLQVPFGKWAELEAVKNANWPEMAGAVDSINQLILELVDKLEKGEGVDAELQDKIRQENNKLVQYAAQIMGKIPTNSPINGEFSHPITLANLMGSMLEQAEAPLTVDQKAAIAELGVAYESDYDALQASYTEDTTRLEKLMDELELKRDNADSMQAVLSEEQQEFVVHPRIQHRLQLDTLSPFTMAIMLTQPMNAKSPEEIRNRLPGYAKDKFGIDLKETGMLDTIVDSYMRDLEPILNSPVENPREPLHIDQAIIAGQAQVSTLKQLLAIPGIDDTARTKILSEIGWGVPRIVSQPKTDE